jgi:hypothetical protein
MKELFSNQHFTVLAAPAAHFVRVVRTAEPFRTADEITGGWAEVSRCFDRLGRKGLLTLMDLRNAPARNDPEFEKPMTAALVAVRRDVKRIAVLVRTAVGGLQVKRVAKAAGAEEFITSSEEEALEYLRTESG